MFILPYTTYTDKHKCTYILYYCLHWPFCQQTQRGRVCAIIILICFLTEPVEELKLIGHVSCQYWGGILIRQNTHVKQDVSIDLLWLESFLQFFFKIQPCWCAYITIKFYWKKSCVTEKDQSKCVAKPETIILIFHIRLTTLGQHNKNNGKMSPSSRHSALILSQKLHWPSLYNDSPSCSVWVCAFVCLFSTVSHSVWISKLWETALLRRQKCRETDSEGADRARNSRSQTDRLFQFSCLC